MNRPSPIPTAANPLETLSALVDGQVQGDELGQAMADCAQNPALLAAWRDYHLVGEYLRAPAADRPLVNDEAAFLQRLHARMGQGGAASLDAETEAVPVVQHVLPKAAANDGRFAWRAVAALALAVGVGSVGWNLLSDSGDAGPALAQANAPVLVQSAQGTIERDARLDELLAAHRQLGGLSALPAPAGFLRHAAFDVPAAPAAGR